MSNDSSSGKPFLIIAFAVIVVAALSFVPWSKVTGNFFKEYDLFKDISDVKIERGEADEIIDPALLAAQAEAEESGSIDSVDSNETVKPRQHIAGSMEDYSENGDGLALFKRALAQRDVRPVRIAIIGDSYIEGDIFSMSIREKLQAKYGGRGVGYVTPHSETSAFRTSIRQSDKGWKAYDLREDNTPNCRWLAGQRFTAEPGATVTWTAGAEPAHVRGWNSATILFKSTGGGVLETNAGNGSQQHTVKGSSSVQAIELEGEMTKLTLTNRSVSGLTVLGAWVNDKTGVTLDCMSLRANSGLTHGNLSPEFARDMARFVDFDLIIVEYGLNALSSKRKNYAFYRKAMTNVLSLLKKCYPNASVVMMGSGDRGQKSGSEVHSMATVEYLIEAQRQAAHDNGVVFWDTREAMGGEDAIVTWRNENLVNSDYIHLNAKGGDRLADLFVKALEAGL